MIGLYLATFMVIGYIAGFARGMTVERAEAKKADEQLQKELVELRKWKADNIGKEKA